MTAADIFESIKSKQSFLCVGLDTDLNKLPECLKTHPDPMWAFNKAIIDATIDLCVAYKLNTAFYESAGLEGMRVLKQTLDYIPPTVFKIADAKRGDIGNTSDMYARAFFESFPSDAVTVAPYMGQDSVEPFLKYPGKWAIILGLTSNIGAKDFQTIKSINGISLFEDVIRKSSTWGHTDNTMFVIGATRENQFEEIRQIVPNHFLLVPGVGAQGGNLQEVCRYGLNKQCGLLINNSRQIIYASAQDDFAGAARAAAQQIQNEMSHILKTAHLL